MTRSDQLTVVKQSLNITGSALDNALGVYLDEIVLYMIEAGVSSDVVSSTSAIGTICKGVSDLYIDKALSNYFYQRVTQLSIQVTEEDDDDNTVTTDYNEVII